VLDPRLQAKEAARWVARADRDLAAVDRSVAIEPLLTDVAAYHCQQAAEKLLKAVLVLSAIRPRKTHDLEELGDEVEGACPAIAPTVTPLRAITRWGFVYRYPDPTGMSEPEPSVAEVAAVREAIAALRAAVVALIEAVP
jgi:HEPN domain-containing protein